MVICIAAYVLDSYLVFFGSHCFLSNTLNFFLFVSSSNLPLVAKKGGTSPTGIFHIVNTVGLPTYLALGAHAFPFLQYHALTPDSSKPI